MKQNIIQQKLLRVEKSEKYYAQNNIIHIVYRSTAQMKYIYLYLKMHINTYSYTQILQKSKYIVQFSLSCVQLFATPWTTACQASLSAPMPRVHPNPCPLSQWCHQTISFSVVPFSSCLQSFPASGSFQMSQLLASGSQSFGVSASTSALPMNADTDLL